MKSQETKSLESASVFDRAVWETRGGARCVYCKGQPWKANLLAHLLKMHTDKMPEGWE